MYAHSMSRCKFLVELVDLIVHVVRYSCRVLSVEVVVV